MLPVDRVGRKASATAFVLGFPSSSARLEVSDATVTSKTFKVITVKIVLNLY